MEMQQPPTLDFSNPNAAFVANDSFRQEQLKARQGISESLIQQMKEEDSAFDASEATDKSSMDVSNIFRQIQQQTKNTNKSALGSEAVTAVAAPIQQATSKLLQQSWLNLPDTYGLSFIWINIHWVLNVAIGDKFFCDLGSEWLPKGTKGGAAVDSLFGLPTAGVGLLEKATIIALDMFIAAVILASLSMVVIIVYYAAHLGSAFIDLGPEILKAFTF